MGKNWFCKISCLVASMVITTLQAGSQYVFCIEGGGTKTTLQVLNQKGDIVPLIQNEIQNDKIVGMGANINIIGKEGVKQVINSLLENSKIQGEDRPLSQLFGESVVVAGMPGVTPPQNKAAVTAIFEEKGISKDNIHVLSDGEMALELVGDKGIILISGTGSVCFGKEGENRFRVGGLGKVLGDEGSGYHIGLEAIKAALAETYGWGEVTKLTSDLKEFFQVEDLKSLIPQIGLGEISPSKIASCAPIVFEEAWNHDRLALEVIDSAAEELGDLLSKMLKTSHLSGCEVHLYGGVFKNSHAKEFIQKIRSHIPNAPKNLKIINKADDNPAVLYAIKYIIPKTD